MTTLFFRETEGMVRVMLRSDEPVNAWQGRVIISGGSAGSIETGNLTDIWQTRPALSGEGIYFAGGVKSGFSGEGELFRLTLSPGTRLSFSSGTSAYLYDGLGTAAHTELKEMTVGAAGTPAEDVRPPAAFTVSKYRSADLFDGMPVAIFGAEDPGSGIARYEVREETVAGTGGWHPAESPYLLQEDVLKLEVRAIDNAGNMRTESLTVAARADWLWPLYVTAAAALILILMRYTYKKR